MIKINHELQPADLLPNLQWLWELSAAKIWSIDRDEVPGAATPVFTVKGKYTARGWTEWTQGFVYGSAILQFDAWSDPSFLKLGRDRTIERMAHHITHVGVHDHGFNNVSTYGNLWRLMREGRIDANERERDLYELALKCSGAVQATRWTYIAGQGNESVPPGGYIYSFNGPHSLFADTIRSLRALAVSHQLGHVLMGERDEKISLLARLVQHARTTAQWAVYYGDSRDAYDVRGRVAHESIFNVNDGSYRCPNSQQGYSPFTTWTRGLAWIMCGFAEQLEFLAALGDNELEKLGGRGPIEAMMLKTARAACDFYIEQTPSDGIPYWDTGAPQLHRLGNYLDRPAEPFNDFEPVDSSAAAIAAQALLRLGHCLRRRGEGADAKRYWQAGLTVLRTLFDEPYLSSDPSHQGLLLHSIYHRPNGWDFIPLDRKIPCGESSMWGDYHAREAALYLQRVIEQKPYLAFFDPAPGDIFQRRMIISDLAEISGRRYPARRLTQSLAGGGAPIQARNFSMGNVTLDPNGGQVPWHNQEQEEVYFVVEGTGEMCLGEERQTVTSGQMVYIPSGVFHQLTNLGETPLRMIYCYGPAGDVAHWRQELDGTLPRAGIEAPPLPDGAWEQCAAQPAS